MRRILGAATVAITLLFMGMAPAQAEAPSPSISSSITDKTNKIDDSRVELLVNQVQAETNYELYVYVTDSLSGKSGAQWAVETANASGLNSVNAVLFVIATEDRKYGSAYPTGSSISSQISQIEAAAIPLMKEGDWDGAVEAYGNKLISASHAPAVTTVTNSDNGGKSESTDKAVGGFFNVLTSILALFAGLGVIALGIVFGGKAFRKIGARRQEIKDTDARIAKFNANLPNAVTKVDTELNDVNEQISFYVTMHGEAVMEGASKYAAAASKDLQAAITYMGEAGASKDRNVVSRALKHADSEIRSARTGLNEAQKIVRNVKSQMDLLTAQAKDLEAISESLKGFVTHNAPKVVSLKASYDAEYISTVTTIFPQLKELSEEIASKVAEVSPESDYQKSRRNVSEGTSLAETATKLQKRFSKALIAINEFDVTREKSLEEQLKSLRSNDDLNKHPKVVQAYDKAVKAIEAARSVDITKGNPERAVAQALNPITEYLFIVKGMRLDAQKVSTSKKVAESILAQKWGQIDTLVKDSTKLGIIESKAEQEALYEAVKMTGEPFTVLRQKVKSVGTYDAKGISDVVAEVNEAIEQVNVKVAVTAAKVARVKARQEEELRQKRIAEEIRRKKAQEVEEERRRKRRREEDDRRRSENDRRTRSSSSSSYSGYGGGYGGDSGGSSSSFSGSGGSFGDSGSGGSF